MSEEMHYASRGVGNAALATGIIGTALGAINWGGIGNVFGGKSADAYCQSFEGKVSSLESEIAQLRAEKYSEQVAKEVYISLDKKISDNLEKLYGFVIDLDKKSALNTQALEYENRITNNKIDHNKEMCECAYNNIMTYVNATFLPGTLKLPITSICPEPAIKTTTTTGA